MILERENTRFRTNREGRPSDSPQRTNHRPWSVLLNLFILALLLLTTACNSGTGSTTSAGATGSGGTGVGWVVSVKVFTATISIGRGERTSVLVTVKDAAGGAAPKGTQVMVTAARGSFLTSVDTQKIASSLFATTENDNGEVMVTYVPQREITILGADGKPTQSIESISTGTDTIQATSKGAFGSATVQISS